jgi:hypothetical protein
LLLWQPLIRHLFEAAPEQLRGEMRRQIATELLARLGA